jgi:transcriptional regulator with XRE-family HTH domain
MYEIFVQLLDRTGKKASDVAKATGIPSSTFSDWKKGKSSPKAEKLQKIADYFGVSVDYLMTGKEELDEKKNPYSDLKGIYLSYAKEAQDSGIDPDDIRLAIDTIKRLRGGK